MKLADEWRHAWKWGQTWLIATVTMAPVLYDQLAPLQDNIPAAWFKVFIGLLGFLTIINNVRKKS